MKFLVSAEFTGRERHTIEPWLEVENPVWEDAAPLGVFLNAADMARYDGSDFAALMALLQVPVSNGETLDDFCAAAMAARLGQLRAEAAEERAAAAALRQDYRVLQDNFLAVEGFLNGALTPKFTLARHWDFADDTVACQSGEKIDQALPVSSAALVAVDLWLESGMVQVCLLTADGALATDPVTLTGTGWQRAQFAAIAGSADQISLQVVALEDSILGLSHASPWPEYGKNPMALRLWKGLTGVEIPDVSLQTKSRQFIMPADFPTAEPLGAGSAKLLEIDNVLVIHTDYFGAANLALRNIGIQTPISAHIQNCGPDTLEVSITHVPAGATAATLYCPSVFLSPEAYMQCEIIPDNAPDLSDLIIKIKGQTSLDRLCLRGLEIE